MENMEEVLLELRTLQQKRDLRHQEAAEMRAELDGQRHRYTQALANGKDGVADTAQKRIAYLRERLDGLDDAQRLLEEQIADAERRAQRVEAALEESTAKHDGLVEELDKQVYALFSDVQKILESEHNPKAVLELMRRASKVERARYVKQHGERHVGPTQGERLVFEVPFLHQIMMAMVQHENALEQYRKELNAAPV